MDKRLLVLIVILFKFMKYSFRKGAYKTVGAGVVIALAMLIDQVVGQNLWGVNTITIGAVLMGLKNFLKVKTGLSVLG